MNITQELDPADQELEKLMNEVEVEEDTVEQEVVTPESTVKCASCDAWMTHTEVELYEDVCVECLHDDTQGIMSDDVYRELR